MEFTYLMQPPNRYTFKQPKLKKWVEEHCEGLTLNLFAGIVKLNIDEIRVDIDENVEAHHYGDAYEFVKWCVDNNIKFDTLLLDPPYNLRKAREKYDGRYIGSFTKIKNLLPQILNDNGVVIILGYDTVGMGKGRGFKKEHVCIICHSGDHNDTLCLKERKL